MNGFIKLWRLLLDKPIWLNSTPEQCKILVTLLLMANHSESEWEWNGNKFKAIPGQFVTSLDAIVKKCGKGVTIQNVRTALVRFEKLEFLTNESTKTGRLITIVNWRVYQPPQDETNKGNSQRPNKELTPNGECKNINNIYSLHFDSFWAAYPRKTEKRAAFKVWNTRLKEGAKPDDLIMAAKNYAAECEKEGREPKFTKQAKTFLGPSRPYEDYLSQTEITQPEKTFDQDRAISFS